MSKEQQPKQKKAKKKSAKPKSKVRMHIDNPMRLKYEFDALVEASSELKPFIKANRYGDDSIDFADPDAVRSLNKALLEHHFDISDWQLPEGFLCPPIPGRTDYVLHAADILAKSNKKVIPQGETIRVLDIGVGASAVYPLIGEHTFGWSFVGSDIDKDSLENVNAIVARNHHLKGKIETRFQGDAWFVFKDVIKSDDLFDLTVCNPPFHKSGEEASGLTKKKLKNLARSKASKLRGLKSIQAVQEEKKKEARVDEPIRNFGGKNGELWCVGGELRFVNDMIRESKDYSNQVFWFSTLVSRQEHLQDFYYSLEQAGATEVHTVKMGQGSKVSRILVWTFLDGKQRQAWVNARWAKALGPKKKVAKKIEKEERETIAPNKTTAKPKVAAKKATTKKATEESEEKVPAKVTAKSKVAAKKATTKKATEESAEKVPAKATAKPKVVPKKAATKKATEESAKKEPAKTAAKPKVAAKKATKAETLTATEEKKATKPVVKKPAVKTLKTATQKAAEKPAEKTVKKSVEPAEEKSPEKPVRKANLRGLKKL